VELKAGWLDRQFDKVNEEVRDWPEWMRREAGFSDQESDFEKVTRSDDSGAGLSCAAKGQAE
jgi:hypothetical protein